MSQATVTQLISRLMSDAGVRSAIATNLTSALAGYDLTDAERTAFTRVDLSSLDGAANGPNGCNCRRLGSWNSH